MFEYIQKYGKLSFNDKEINSIDILIFSQLSYLKLNDIRDNYTLYELNKILDKTNIKKLGPSRKYALLLLDLMSKYNRYKNIIITNIEYELDINIQYGAITLLLDNKDKVICFEGTDTSIEGWREDASLCYLYPTKSHLKGIQYLKNNISVFDRNIYVCGHSKGGNIALISSMNINIFKRNKIKNIYSFDGPGLKEKEFESKNYKSIRNKLLNIIPNNSLVGVLFNQENVKVVKSNTFGISQHYVNTWVIKDDDFEYTDQSIISIKLNESINNWLLKTDYLDRKSAIDYIFDLLKKLGINDFNELKNVKLKVLIETIKTTKDISEETKQVLVNCIKILISEVGQTIKNEIHSFIKK